MTATYISKEALTATVVSEMTAPSMEPQSVTVVSYSTAAISGLFIEISEALGRALDYDLGERTVHDFKRLYVDLGAFLNVRKATPGHSPAEYQQKDELLLVYTPDDALSNIAML